MQLTNMPRDQHTKIDSNSLIPTIKKQFNKPSTENHRKPQENIGQSDRTS